MVKINWCDFCNLKYGDMRRTVEQIPQIAIYTDESIVVLCQECYQILIGGNFNFSEKE